MRNVEQAAGNPEGGTEIIPIGLYRAADVIFLHELTHATWGGSTLDVEDAYEWENVRAISNDMSEVEDEKSTMNAENYAYFCLGATMLSPGAPKMPQIINEDGTISALEEADLRKRGA